MCGPLVCQLCDSDFLYEADFTEHKKHDHGGANEYRKRVLYLMQQTGCRAITGQEKRIMLQNFAHFQQFSRPGAKGNTFVSTPEVPRCEAACALCQQKDFIEYRHKLALFGIPPQTTERTFATNVVQDAVEASDDEDPTERPTAATGGAPYVGLVKHGDVYYLQSPGKDHALLDVNRYMTRWPLIPAEELHASSVQHPINDQCAGFCTPAACR